MRKIFLLNFAHPLPGWIEKKYKIISIPVQIPTEITNSPDGTRLVEYMAEIVIRVVRSDSKLEGAVMAGKYAVVLPGLSQAAAAVLAILHGLSGHFPRIFWQYRGPDGFEPIRGLVDIQALREQARAGRSFGAGVAVLREVCPRCGKVGPHECN